MTTVVVNESDGLVVVEEQVVETVTVTDGDEVVTISETEVEIVTVVDAGPQGPQGPQGEQANTEDIQDIVGAMMTDNSVIDFTYNDGAGTITATIVSGSVTAAMLNFDPATQAELDAVAAAKANVSHTHVSTDVTDFTEAAQDAVGAALTDTATIDFTYNDGSNTITADVKDNSIGTGKLSFDVATQAELDAVAAAKANVSHTHTASNVTDFSEAVDDRVAALLVEGTNVNLTYDDTANTLTIDVASVSTEDVQDIVGALLTDSSVIDFTYNDPAGTITATIATGSVTAAMLSFDPATQAELDAHINDTSDAHDASAISYGGNAGLSASDVEGALDELDNEKAAVSHTHTASNITDFSEAVDDRVAALLVEGTNVTLTYNDGAGTLTIDASGGAALLNGSGDPSDLLGSDGEFYLDTDGDGALWGPKTGGTWVGFGPFVFASTDPILDGTWTVTNETTDKSFDADSLTLNELADVVGTLIEHLKVTPGGGGGGGGGGPWTDPSGIQTLADGEVADILDYEFDGTATGEDTWVVAGGDTCDPVIDRGVMSIVFKGQSFKEMAAVLWNETLAVGETMEIAWRCMGDWQDYPMVGIVLSEGTSATSQALFTGTYYQYVETLLINMTGPLNAMNEDGSFGYWERYRMPVVPFRVRLTRDASTTYSVTVSPDGVSWVTMGVDLTGTWTGTPSYLGIGVSGSGATNDQVATVEYLRIFS